MKFDRNEDLHARNAEIWGSTRSPSALLAENMKLVYAVASRHARKMGRERLIEEYKQAAVEGFLYAFEVKDWDPDVGTLNTFTAPWMRHKMQLDVDRELGWWGMAASQTIVRGTRSFTHMPTVGSLNRKLKPHTKSQTELGDILHDSTRDDIDDVEAEVSRAQTIEEIRRMLTPQERGWFEDWLACDDPGRPLIELSAKWACTKPTVANRLGQIKLAVRDLLPDQIIGPVKVGRWRNSDQ